MAVRTDSPQIAALKIAVEARMKHIVESRADFSNLALKIEEETHEHLAENTLRRIWGKIDGYDTVFTRTLDVLSRFVGFEHWNDFCEILKKNAGIESEVVKSGNCIKSEDLQPGDRVRIGWLPDRICTVEYLGKNRFKAVECKNSTMQPGDCFECGVMLKNYPLFVDNLVHGDELFTRYLMGMENGLSTLEKI